MRPLRLNGMGRNPLSIFTYGLLFYALVTLGFNLDVPHLFHALAVALLFGIAYLVMRFAMKTRIDWRNFMISGIIMFLLIEPEIGALEYTFLTLAVFLVVIAKSIRYKGQPIVNPVVFGISISYLILLLSGQFLFVTWWGAAYRNSSFSRSCRDLWCIQFPQTLARCFLCAHLWSARHIPPGVESFLPLRHWNTLFCWCDHASRTKDISYSEKRTDHLRCRRWYPHVHLLPYPPDSPLCHGNRGH